MSIVDFLSHSSIDIMANKLNEHGQKIVPMTVEQQREHAQKVGEGFQRMGVELNGEVHAIAESKTTEEIAHRLRTVLEACMQARNGRPSYDEVHANGDVSQFFDPKEESPSADYTSPLSTNPQGDEQFERSRKVFRESLARLGIRFYYNDQNMLSNTRTGRPVETLSDLLVRENPRTTEIQSKGLPNVK